MSDRVSNTLSNNPSPALLADVVARPEPEIPIGASEGFLHVLRKIELFAPADDVPVLLEGESGTGKTLLARYLHDRSPRANEPFVVVESGTLDDDLASSALFGHLKGAYTGATARRAGYFVEASGGTIFLDEIGKASRQVQQRLLRAVEAHEVTPVGADRPVKVDVRVVCATNVPLRELVASGSFLPDLAARIRTCTVRIPPLRERRADIPLLVRYFVDALARTPRYPKPPAVSDRLMSALVRAPWMDNARELSGAVTLLLIVAWPAKTLLLEHCEDELQYLRAFVGRSHTHANAIELEQLARERGSMRTAALETGISLATAYRLVPRSKRPSGGAPKPESPAIGLRLSQSEKGSSENSQKP